MTVYRKAMPVLLLFCAIFATMVVLTTTARADTKHVTFSEPVTVGRVVLTPGEYAVTWTGTGPEVIVSFVKDGEVVATAPARLVLEKSPQRSYVTVAGPDNSRLLKQLVFRSKTLVFDLTS